MNQVKKTTFAGRIRNAWRALRGKPVGSLTLGVNVKQCKDCDYRYTAEEKVPPSRYFHEITYLDNVVLVVLYEATEGGKVELARGHGHIIHEGAAGVTQATSYALKRIWWQIRK
jgi:hypothetical protein